VSSGHYNICKGVRRTLWTRGHN